MSDLERALGNWNVFDSSLLNMKELGSCFIKGHIVELIDIGV